MVLYFVAVTAACLQVANVAAVICSMAFAVVTGDHRVIETVAPLSKFLALTLVSVALVVGITLIAMCH